MNRVAIGLTLFLCGCLQPQRYVAPQNLNARTGATVKLVTLEQLSDSARVRVNVYVADAGVCSESRELGGFDIHVNPDASVIVPAGRAIELYSYWSKFAYTGIPVIDLAVNRYCEKAVSFVPQPGKTYQHVFQVPEKNQPCRAFVLEISRDWESASPVAVQDPNTCPRRGAGARSKEATRRP